MPDQCETRGKCGYRGKGRHRKLVLCKVCQHKLDEYRVRQENREIRNALGKSIRRGISEDDNRSIL